MKPRRKFIKHVAFGATGMGLMSSFPGFLASCSPGSSEKKESADTTATAMQPTADAPLFFEFSLAEWSLHKMLFDKKLDNLDFPAMAKNKFGINAVEYVNQFFKDKAKDQDYLNELKKRTGDLGVTNVLIMIDGEGALAETDDAKRKEAVENHYKWVDAAKFLGCHSIRVNAAGTGSREDMMHAAIDGLGMLCEYGAQQNIGIIVENHGGFSSDGQWLSEVMRQVNNPVCGTLPDFGNFCLKHEETADGSWGKCIEEYDRYKGVRELMPYAKGVSAKSYDFNEAGEETEMDYKKLLSIVKEAGYTGHIGIEYEGSRLSEPDGIMATKKLMMKVGKELS